MTSATSLSHMSTYFCQTLYEKKKYLQSNKHPSSTDLWHTETDNFIQYKRLKT